MVLPPSLMQHWERALAACETAITLRARVALFFPATSEMENDSHAYFLDRLRSWLKTLNDAKTPMKTTTSAHTHSGEKDEKRVDFSNYYAVLELPDDYFQASSTEHKVTSGPTAANAPAVDTDKLFNDAFENEVNMELSFLFMELEELLEAVHGAFLDVKRHKKTLVEATVVAKVAIDCAESVIAKLQLRFPSIRTADDIITMVTDRIQREPLNKLMATANSAWIANQAAGTSTGESKYPAVTIIADMLWVSRALRSFVAKPFAPDTIIQISEEFAGELYSEERTPHYCAPDLLATPSFWMQQLAALYNSLNKYRALGFKQDTKTFSGWFLAQADEYFTKRSPSIHFVFIMICWVRSVSDLQGEGGLGRTVSLSIMHRWDLEDRLRASMAHGEVLRAYPAFQNLMNYALHEIQWHDQNNAILRANPLFAGFVLLDSQFKYLHLGGEALHTARFRILSHIYNALRDRQLLDTIPLFEDVLQVYERMVFTPTRGAAVQGSLTRSFLISSGMTEATVDAMLGRRAPPKHLATRLRDDYHLPDLSRVFRLLAQKDFSVLPTVSATTSWKTLLRSVSDLCSKELFESRVFSRDMLKFSDDLTDTFNALCDVLGCRDDVNRILEKAALGIASQEYVDAEVESIVALPVLAFLDSLNVDGSIRVGDNTADLLHFIDSRVTRLAHGGNRVTEVSCRRAASLIMKRFGQPEPSELEARYYSFPAAPQWSLLEFSKASLHSEPQRGKSADNFCALMEMMEQSSGPLRPNDLLKFKSLIKADPAILNVGAFDDSMSEMCTLLHHAAAGPARDRRLVEWLVQMGALHHQSQHCRHPPPPEVVAANGMDISCLFNALAVHCAAKAGLMDMVRLLLEADNMRDLDTVTFHTRESLAHLAVKNGRRKVCDMLITMGANFLLRDAAGKYAYELTSDMSWKKVLLMVTVDQRREEEEERKRKFSIAKLDRNAKSSSEKLRQELALQRETERVDAQNLARRGVRVTKAKASISTAPATTSSAPALETTVVSTAATESLKGSTSSKSKKNKKNKKQSAPESTKDAALSQVAAKMQQLLVGTAVGDTNEKEPVTKGGSAQRGKPSDEKLRLALEVLKEGSTASSAERAAAVKEALTIVDYLRDHVQFLSDKRAKHDIMLALREEAGLEASRVVFMLNKFYRQLPEPPRRPRADVWKPRVDEATLSPWEKLVKRTGPPFDFDDYLAFALPTAEVLAACGRVAQAKEILELVERRLLKMQQRPPMFRKCIESYTMARREMRVEPVSGSSPEVRRAFEWYSKNFTDWADMNELFHIDQLYGFQWFFKLKLLRDGETAEQVDYFLDWIMSLKSPELDSVVYLNDCIAAGSDSRDGLARVLSVVWEVARQCGLQVSQSESVFEASKVSLAGFEFSATGIVRESRA